MLNALRLFVVVETQGRLRELSLCGSSISTQLFLEICSACPQLKELDADWGLPNIASADVDVFAAELSRSCPLLEYVNIQRDELFEPGRDLRDALSEPQVPRFEAKIQTGSGYVPSRFDKIEATARQCVGAEALGLSTVHCVGRPRGTAHSDAVAKPHQILVLERQHLLRRRQFCDSQRLGSAEGNLCSQTIFLGRPSSLDPWPGPGPSLKELYFGEEATLDDACVAVICENLKLEALHIDDAMTR